jgi:hypothetical protein
VFGRDIRLRIPFFLISYRLDQAVRALHSLSFLLLSEGLLSSPALSVSSRLYLSIHQVINLALVPKQEETRPKLASRLLYLYVSIPHAMHPYWNRFIPLLMREKRDAFLAFRPESVLGKYVDTFGTLILDDNAESIIVGIFGTEQYTY